MHSIAHPNVKRVYQDVVHKNVSAYRKYGSDSVHDTISVLESVFKRSFFRRLHKFLDPNSIEAGRYSHHVILDANYLNYFAWKHFIRSIIWSINCGFFSFINMIIWKAIVEFCLFLFIISPLHFQVCVIQSLGSQFAVRLLRNVEERTAQNQTR